MPKFRVAVGIALMALSCTASAAQAATTEVVSESDVARQAETTPPSDNWVIYARTPASTASFRFGPSAQPLGVGSLELATPGGGDKVYAFNYDHVGTELSEVDDISYATYREAGSAQQVAALNVVIDFNGPDADGGFSTLVFEPVYNPSQGPVESGKWQTWTAHGTGIWWSTRPINGQCAGATSACDKTWDEIVANNPAATVLGGVGVNQGTGNPGLTTAVDAFTFDETTYDFDPRPTTKDDCKDGGFAAYGSLFKNQGDCVSSVASGGRA